MNNFKTIFLIISIMFASYSPAIFSANIGQDNFYSKLNFSVAPKNKLVFSQYHHQSLLGIEVDSKYQISSWLDIAVNLQEKYKKNFSQVDLTTKITSNQKYSALANFGRKVSYKKHNLTPFAQLRINYQQEIDLGQQETDLGLSIQEELLNSVKLQYGLGVRYSNISWLGLLGLSLLYNRQSSLNQDKPQSLAENLPLMGANSSIGINIDLSF